MTLSRRWTAALLAALAVLVLCVAVMVSAGDRVVGLSGVSELAAGPDGGTWMVLNGELYRLDAEDKVALHLDRAALRTLELRGRIATLAADPGGGVWIGSLDQAMLRRLDDDGQPMARLEVGASAAGSIFGDFTVALEPLSRNLIVADTQNHRLLAFSPGEGRLLSSKSPLEFRYPNGLAAHPDGFVVVANTNEHRLDGVRADLGSADWQVTADRNPAGCYSWPVFVTVDPGSGRVWASWHGADLRLGHVVAYERNGTVRHRLALGPDVEPLALLARSEDVLVSVLDDSGYAVRRFDHAGARLSDFGGAFVSEALHTVFVDRKRWTAIREITQKATIASGFALIALALWARRRTSGSDSFQAASVVIPWHPGEPYGWREQLRLHGWFLVMIALVIVSDVVVKRAELPAEWSTASKFLPPLLFLIALIPLMRPASLERLRRLHVQRLVQNWQGHFGGMLADDERLLDYVAAPSTRMMRLLIVTNRRLIFLRPMPLFSRGPLREIEIEDLDEPEIGRRWWLLGKDARVVELRDARRSDDGVQIVCRSRDQMRELMSALEVARSAQAGPREKATGRSAWRSNGREQEASPSRFWIAIILSLLMPGTGHLYQGRTVPGTVFLLGALALLVPISIVLYVRFFHIMDMRIEEVVVLLVIYGFLGLASAVSASIHWDVRRPS